MSPENKKDNPIQKDYDDKFDPIKQAENKGTMGSSGSGKKGPGEISGIGGVRNAEKSPAGFYKPKMPGATPSSAISNRFLAAAKKRSPVIAIILTLVGGVIGISGLLTPGLLLVHVKETLATALDSASPALSIRTNKMLFYKFKTAKNSFSQSSDGKCNIKCKFGSMNDAMKRNLEARGFTVDAEEGHGLSKGRWIIKTLTFPDGTKVKSGKEFSIALKDVKRAASFRRVFNSKIAYFLNSKFGTILKEKFGLDKVDELTAKMKESAKDKAKSLYDRFKESMNSTLGYPEIDPNAPAPTPSEELDSTGKFKGLTDFVSGPAVTLAGKVTNAAGAMCMSYDIARGITYSTKVAKIAALAGFAMIFLKAADEIKAGDADPDTVAQLSNQLTQVTDPSDPNSPSATNSLGYRMADNGDQGVLSDTDKTYTAAISSAGALGILATILHFLGKSGKTGMSAARLGCKVAGNTLLSIGVSCPEEIAAAAATGAETFGIGALISAITCAVKTVVTSEIFGHVIGVALGAIIPAIAKTEIPKLGGDLVGSAAGDALYTGTAQILGGEAASYGLKAGTKQQIAQYSVDTATIKQQEDAIASYDAQSTPFDITNQYSFIGKLASSLNIDSLFGSSLSTSASNILSIVPKSFALLTNTAGAEAYKKADLYGGKCVDTGLDQVGVDADVFCNPSYVMSGDEMNADIDTTTQYMIDNNYIDADTGTANTNTDYQKYLDNCANRTDPLGETGGSITDDDYYWEVGSKCMDQSEMMSNFRTYTMDQSISDTMDGDATSDNPAPAPSPVIGNINIDYTDNGANVPCAAGTTDTSPAIQEGYYANNSHGNITLNYGGSPYKVSKVKIRTCNVGSDKPVNSQISASAHQMLKDNNRLSIFSGFRSMALQISLWNADPNPVMVAEPGTSNHQMGIAMDLACDGTRINDHSNPCFVWLTNNAAKYGFKNYPREPWHWSVTGT
jgi:hypothetical protein